LNNRFTEKAERALNHSVEIAEDFGHTYIGTEHLLLALFEDELSTSAFVLKKCGIKQNVFKKAISDYSGSGIKTNLSAHDMTTRAKKIVEQSYENAIKYGNTTIGTEHLLLSIIEERECIATKLLKSINADILSIKDEIITILRSREKTVKRKQADIPVLKQYGRDFTEMAAEDKFDPVIGREKEIDRVIRILCRKNKNNPCLIGEAGVGKSAIVEGLAQKIARGDVPSHLLGKSIISVDLTSMVAGAKYRGDFEERIKNIVNEASKNKSIILFIDELHTIVGAGSAEGAIDASNILKPQLSRADIQIIGATTFAEYRKYIEKDPALERRFQPITVEEPSPEETVRMLSGIKSRYEKHHGVKITNEVIEECVKLSVRYITDRFLPDKAIDLLDEACALVHSGYGNNVEKIKETREIIRQTQIRKENAIKEQDFSLALKLKEIEEKYKKEYEALTDGRGENGQNCVTVSDVKKIVSEITGIDISSIKRSHDYSLLYSSLTEEVFGQESAIYTLLNAIKRSDIGIGDSSKPKGVFLFLGKSGVGKTALATALAKGLFNNKNALLRFDMSEYSEKQSVSKLIGAPPGYQGHDEGGTLTEAVRKKPYSVILFDEIEKADKEVLNLFLQIADYGYLTDSTGRTVNFRNTIIIMTSNSVKTERSERAEVGFIEKSEKTDSLISNLKHYFSEEFISRFDEIILFKKLDEVTLLEITKKRLLLLKSRLEEKNIKLIYDSPILNYIVKKAYREDLGARAIIRYITNKIENLISDYILSSENEGNEIYLEISDDEIIVKSSKKDFSIK